MKIITFKSKIFSLIILLILIGSIFTINIDATNSSCKSGFLQKDAHYYSYEELTDLLKSLDQEYSDIFMYESLGNSHEGRDLWLVKISDNVEINESEPRVLYTGGMHGNEKPGYQTIITSIISILENYTTSNVNESFTERVRNIVNNTELFFIPMVNPDGVEANKRKNCRENKCILGKTLFSGVDICRNFDYLWNDVFEHPFRYIFLPRTIDDLIWVIKQKNFYMFERSVVRYPFLDFGSIVGGGYYRGPNPFSEPESQAIKQVVEEHDIKIWLDYHIYGEEIRIPEVPSFNGDDYYTFQSIAENITKIDGYNIFIPPDCLDQACRPYEWMYTNHNIFCFIVEICSSIKDSEIYDEAGMSTVFKNHLKVNLYVAERTITMG